MTTITRSRGWIAVAGALALIGLALWLSPPGSAIDQTNEKPAPLGLVGLTEGQTLRISVANVVGFDRQPDPPGCRLQVGFVDEDGSVIGDPNLFELRPGAARSFDHVAIGNPGIRQYVRPVVVDLVRKSQCPAVVSGEILDRAGLNGFIINWSVAFPDPWLSK